MDPNTKENINGKKSVIAGIYIPNNFLFPLE